MGRKQRQILITPTDFERGVAVASFSSEITFKIEIYLPFLLTIIQNRSEVKNCDRLIYYYCVFCFGATKFLIYKRATPYHLLRLPLSEKWRCRGVKTIVTPRFYYERSSCPKCLSVYVSNMLKAGDFHWANRSDKRVKIIDGIYRYILYAFGYLNCRLNETPLKAKLITVGIIPGEPQVRER